MSLNKKLSTFITSINPLTNLLPWNRNLKNISASTVNQKTDQETDEQYDFLTATNIKKNIYKEFQTLYDMHERYEWSYSKLERGMLAYKMAQAYFMGRTECETFAPDVEKQTEWFLEALAHDDGDAYWLASRVVNANPNKISENYAAIKSAMENNGYNTDKNSHFLYEAKSCLGFHGIASIHMAKAIYNPNTPSAILRLSALKSLGKEPSPELANEFLAISALCESPEGCLLVRKILRNPEREKDYLIEVLQKNGVEVDADYADSLLINPAFRGDGEASGIVAEAILNPEKVTSKSILKALSQKNIVPTKKLGIQLGLNSAIKGQKASQAYRFSQAIINQNIWHLPEWINEMKEQGIEPSRIMGYQFRIISALDGYTYANDKCCQTTVFSTPHRLSEFTTAIKELKIDLDDRLKATFLKNSSYTTKEKAINHRSLFYMDQAEIKPYTPVELARIKQKAVQNFKEKNFQNNEQPVKFTVEHYNN